MNKDRFRFRVWDNTKNQYVDDSEVELLLNANGDLLLGNWHEVYFAKGNYIIEQCVGLKDGNGTLIYENDIVLGISGFKYCIIWSEMELGWALQNLETRLCIAMNAFTPDDIEIVGNIHEQRDTK